MSLQSKSFWGTFSTASFTTNTPANFFQTQSWRIWSERGSERDQKSFQMWGLFPFFETPVPPHFLFIWREEISKSTRSWGRLTCRKPPRPLRGPLGRRATGSKAAPSRLKSVASIIHGLQWRSLASSCPDAEVQVSGKWTGDFTPVYWVDSFHSHPHSLFWSVTSLFLWIQETFYIYTSIPIWGQLDIFL